MINKEKNISTESKNSDKKLDNGVIAELHNVISKLTIEQFRRTMKEGNNV